MKFPNFNSRRVLIHGFRGKPVLCRITKEYSFILRSTQSQPSILPACQLFSRLMVQMFLLPNPISRIIQVCGWLEPDPGKYQEHGLNILIMKILSVTATYL